MCVCWAALQCHCCTQRSSTIGMSGRALQVLVVVSNTSALLRLSQLPKPSHNICVWVIKQSKRFTLIPLVFELIDSLGRAEGHVNQLVWEWAQKKSVINKYIQRRRLPESEHKRKVITLRYLNSVDWQCHGNRQYHGNASYSRGTERWKLLLE